MDSCAFLLDVLHWSIANGQTIFKDFLTVLSKKICRMGLNVFYARIWIMGIWILEYGFDQDLQPQFNWT